MQLEVKEAIKIEVEIWRRWSLNVTLALEFRAENEIKEIWIQIWNWRNQKDEFKVKCEDEVWRWNLKTEEIIGQEI